MPTYVYACDTCNEQFEQFQSFKDEPLSICRCSAQGKVRRVIQPAGVLFKGSGWYINDSRGTSSSSVGGESPKASPVEKSDTSEKSAKSEPAPASSDG